ncbi:MAG TPA: c-type cytochrome biogenesis protein CcmI [Dokdonella sp.]
MTMFFLLAALMIAAALACIVVPLLRHARAGAASPSDTAARRLRALDQALAAGVVDADEYATKRAAIDAPPAAVAAAPQRSRLTFSVLLLVALLLPASALLLYRLVGAPQALDPANRVAAAPPHGDRGPQMEQAIATLVQRLKDHPEDVEGWGLLGRAYTALGRPGDALDALKHAHALAPDNSALTVEYAQALAVAAPTHRIDGEARELLESVLKTDPKNQRALWLLGISDYQANRFDAAISRWNALLPLLPADSDVVASVRKQIADAEARRDGKAPPESLAESAGDDEADAQAPGGAPPPSSSAAAAHLTVKVALDPKLKDRLDPDATLFIFARAASGPPMPLAIQRLKAGQLPATVALDDSMGMLPTMKLWMFPQVVVGARVSKSGNALPQSGDLQTLSAPLDVHRSEPIELKIDSVVP